MKQLKESINAQGVSFDEKSEEIFVKTTWDSLPQRKNDILQSIINIGEYQKDTNTYGDTTENGQKQKQEKL